MIRDDFIKIIEEIAKKLELREIQVLRVLEEKNKNKNIKSGELIRKSGISQTNLYRLLKELGELAEEELTTELKAKITEIDEKKIEAALKEAQALRPKAKRELDQFYGTRRTVIKRVVKMAKNGDLWNKRIAFLGDDDLTSVAVAATGLAKEIVVFEVDEDLIKVIGERAVKQDLRETFDKKYLNSFDIVFTDPPYTNSGINLFLNRGIELIKKQLTSRIYLCYGNSDRAREREVEVQNLILEHKILIKSKLEQFNKYNGAESIGSSSSLYVLDWTPQTKIVKSENSKIYTNE